MLAWDYAKAVKRFGRLPVGGGAGRGPHPHALRFARGARPRIQRAARALPLGYGEETKNYTKTYRSARDAAMAELPRNAPQRWREASLLLREHGKATCKTIGAALRGVPRHGLPARGTGHAIETGRTRVYY